MIELLWMTEDELREHCYKLTEALLCSEFHRLELINNMGKTLAYGYNRGYTDATVQLKIETQKRDEESYTVH
jgi:hypothetical protein